MERERVGWRSNRVVRWARTRIYKPFMVQLRRGAEPTQLAFSAALGMTLGVFPICGVTVVFCGIAAAILGAKCNPPIMMLSNFVATPLQMSLMLPFLRGGEKIMHANAFNLSKDALWQAVTGRASGELFSALGHAMLGWLVSTPFLFTLLYSMLLPLTGWAQRRFEEETSCCPNERGAPLIDGREFLHFSVSNFEHSAPSAPLKTIPGKLV